MNHTLNRNSMKLPMLLFTVTPWLVFTPAAQADDSFRLSAKVISLVGSARYCDTNRTWIALQAGAEVSAALVLQTGIEDGSTADIALAGSDADAGGKCTIRMFSNSLLKPIRLKSKLSGSVQARDIGLDVPAGQIRLSLDGVSDYEFEFGAGRITKRLAVLRNGSSPQETVFVVDHSGTLTVLKGLVQAGNGSETRKPVHAGEQLRGDSEEVRPVPPEAPELKLGP
jgi:hypothetical protein